MVKWHTEKKSRTQTYFCVWLWCVLCLQCTITLWMSRHISTLVFYSFFFNIIAILKVVFIGCSSLKSTKFNASFAKAREKKMHRFLWVGNSSVSSKNEYFFLSMNSGFDELFFLQSHCIYWKKIQNVHDLGKIAPTFQRWLIFHIFLQSNQWICTQIYRPFFSFCANKVIIPSLYREIERAKKKKKKFNQD